MTFRGFIFCTSLILLLFVAPQARTAETFAQCGIMLTTEDCPVMEMDDSKTPPEPFMKTVNFPLPLGEISIPRKVLFFSGPLCVAESSIRVAMISLYVFFLDAFLKPFTAALLLYVLVYAISFMYGLVNPKDFAFRIAKLAIVFALVTDNCFFYENLYGGFIGASNDLVQIMGKVNTDATGAPATTNARDSQKRLYESLDDLFTNVVGIDGLISVGIFLLASLSSNGQGIPVAILSALGVGSMALALFRALITLGIAFAGISFFLLLTPIFLSFLLFKYTKQLFDAWFSLLISFVLQPFIIFAFLVMMRQVIDTSAPDLDIDKILETATKTISSFKFAPQTAQGIASMDVYLPDRDTIKNLGMQYTLHDGTKEPLVKDGLSRIDIQQRFFQEFTPKILFWFVLNMIMAGFIKEVPGLAHRLSGWVGAPALGATDGSVFNLGRTSGIALPGISRGSGGETLSILGSAIGKNTAIRQMGVAGGMIAGGYMINNMVSEKMRDRDAKGAENKATDGQANREGGGLSRAGTLGELLGTKTATRDGATVEGIGEKGAAGREGPNVTSRGERDGAVRIETTRDFFAKDREKAVERERIAANNNAEKGAELLSRFGVTINPPKLPENSNINRNINIQVQDVKITAVRDKATVYNLNGQEIAVKKEEEEAFLRTQIARIDKDITKASVFGATAAQEIEISAALRRDMQARLDVITAGKGTIETIDKTQQKIAEAKTLLEQKQQTEIELQKLEKLKPITEKQLEKIKLSEAERYEKGKITEAEKQASIKRLNQEKLQLEEKIAALKEFAEADPKAATILRDASGRLPSILGRNDIDAIAQEREKIDPLNFKDVSGSMKATQQAMEKYDVVLKEKEALNSLEMVANRLKTEGKSDREIIDIAREIHSASYTQNPTVGAAKLAEISAQLKKQPDQNRLAESIADVEALQAAMEIVSAQRLNTTQNALPLNDNIPESNTLEAERTQKIPPKEDSEILPETQEKLKREQAFVLALQEALSTAEKVTAENRDPEMIGLGGQINAAAQSKDQTQILALRAQLEKRPDKQKFTQMIAELEALEKAIEASKTQRTDTTLNPDRFRETQEVDDRQQSVSIPNSEMDMSPETQAKMKADQEVVLATQASLAAIEAELKRLREQQESDEELLRIQNELAAAARERDAQEIAEMIERLRKQQEEDKINRNELIESLEELKEKIEAASLITTEEQTFASFIEEPLIEKAALTIEQPATEIESIATTQAELERQASEEEFRRLQQQLDEASTRSLDAAIDAMPILGTESPLETTPAASEANDAANDTIPIGAGTESPPEIILAASEAKPAAQTSNPLLATKSWYADNKDKDDAPKTKGDILKEQYAEDQRYNPDSEQNAGDSNKSKKESDIPENMTRRTTTTSGINTPTTTLDTDTSYRDSEMSIQPTGKESFPYSNIEISPETKVGQEVVFAFSDVQNELDELRKTEASNTELGHMQNELLAIVNDRDLKTMDGIITSLQEQQSPENDRSDLIESLVELRDKMEAAPLPTTATEEQTFASFIQEPPIEIAALTIEQPATEIESIATTQAEFDLIKQRETEEEFRRLQQQLDEASTRSLDAAIDSMQILDTESPLETTPAANEAMPAAQTSNPLQAEKSWYAENTAKGDQERTPSESQRDAYAAQVEAEQSAGDSNKSKKESDVPENTTIRAGGDSLKTSILSGADTASVDAIISTVEEATTASGANATESLIEPTIIPEIVETTAAATTEAITTPNDSAIQTEAISAPEPTINLSTFSEDMKASFGNFITDGINAELAANNLQWSGLTFVSNNTIGNVAIDSIFDELFSKTGSSIAPSLRDELKEKYAEEVGATLRKAYDEGKNPAEVAEIVLRPLTSGLGTAVETVGEFGAAYSGGNESSSAEDLRRHSGLKSKKSLRHGEDENMSETDLAAEEVLIRKEIEEEIEEEKQEALSEFEQRKVAEEETIAQNERANNVTETEQAAIVENTHATTAEEEIRTELPSDPQTFNTELANEIPAEKVDTTTFEAASEPEIQTRSATEDNAAQEPAVSDISETVPEPDITAEAKEQTAPEETKITQDTATEETVASTTAEAESDNSEVGVTEVRTEITSAESEILATDNAPVAETYAAETTVTPEATDEQTRTEMPAQETAVNDFSEIVSEPDVTAEAKEQTAPEETKITQDTATEETVASTTAEAESDNNEAQVTEVRTEPSSADGEALATDNTPASETTAAPEATDEQTRASITSEPQSEEIEMVGEYTQTTPETSFAETTDNPTTTEEQTSTSLTSEPQSDSEQFATDSVSLEMPTNEIAANDTPPTEVADEQIHTTLPSEQPTPEAIAGVYEQETPETPTTETIASDATPAPTETAEERSVMESPSEEFIAATATTEDIAAQNESTTIEAEDPQNVIVENNASPAIEEVTTEQYAFATETPTETPVDSIVEVASETVAEQEVRSLPSDQRLGDEQFVDSVSTETPTTETIASDTSPAPTEATSVENTPLFTEENPFANSSDLQFAEAVSDIPQEVQATKPDAEKESSSFTFATDIEQDEKAVTTEPNAAKTEKSDSQIASTDKPESEEDSSGGGEKKETLVSRRDPKKSDTNS